MQEDTKEKIAAGTGSVAGGAAGVGIVAYSGVAGTAGGAAVTSGLATVGSVAGGVVGGGMLTGLAVVAAAPIAGAAAGYGAYKLYKKLRL